LERGFTGVLSVSITVYQLSASPGVVGSEVRILSGVTKAIERGG
jgi:hypothetical protein